MVKYTAKGGENYQMLSQERKEYWIQKHLEENYPGLTSIDSLKFMAQAMLSAEPDK